MSDPASRDGDDASDPTAVVPNRASLETPSSPPPKPRRDRAYERAEAMLGQVISGRYRIDELIAMGGMGAVYRGEHVHMKKRVAVKILHPTTEILPELVQRFRREAIAGAHVSHRNVAVATDFGELEDGSYFLVLEYVSGTTLHDKMSYGPIDQDEATRIAHDLALALEAVHAKGVVHRDVKPRNVMLTSGAEVVKLIDFGLAKVEIDRLSRATGQGIPKISVRASDPGEGGSGRERITGVGVIFGTIAYIAPECAIGMDAIDARADLYSLGVVFYEMLAGKHLFDGTDAVKLFADHRNTPPPPIHVRAPNVEVHPAIEKVVMDLLEKDPDKRIPDARALVERIDAARAEAGLAPIAAQPESVAPPSTSMPAPRGSARAPEEPASTAPSSRPPPPSEPASFVARHGQALALSSIIVVLSIALAASLLTRPSGGERGAVDGAATQPSSTGATPTAPSSAPTATASSSASSLEQLELDPAATSDAPIDPATLAKMDVVGLRLMLKRAARFRHWTRAEQALLALVDRAPNDGLDDEETRVAARETVVNLAALDQDRGERPMEALARHAGASGLDVLYDIVQTKGRSNTALHAAELLRKPDVFVRASPALQIALQIREAPCDRKLGLLDQAVDLGDVRALTALEAFAVPCFKKKNEKVLAAMRRLKDKLGKP